MISCNLINAQEQYKQGIPINLQFTCTLNNAIPDSSTTFNISIYFQNGSTLVNNQQATGQGQGSFNYTTTFPTSEVYTVKMFCLNSNYNYSNSGNYLITPTGTTLDTVQISIYIFFLLICLAITFFSVKLFRENKFSKDIVTSEELYKTKQRNEFIYYMKVLKQRMWIIGLFGVYLSILIFTALLEQLVYNLGLSDLNNILQYVVIFGLWGLIPFTLFWFVWLILVFYNTTKDIFKFQFGSFRSKK